MELLRFCKEKFRYLDCAVAIFLIPVRPQQADRECIFLFLQMRQGRVLLKLMAYPMSHQLEGQNSLHSFCVIQFGPTRLWHATSNGETRHACQQAPRFRLSCRALSREFASPLAQPVGPLWEKSPHCAKNFCCGWSEDGNEAFLAYTRSPESSRACKTPGRDGCLTTGVAATHLVPTLNGDFLRIRCEFSTRCLATWLIARHMRFSEPSSEKTAYTNQARS